MIFRGPHDRYDLMPVSEWQDLPVCSVPPMRWPKLSPSGKKYSFAEERDMVKNKLRAAVRICIYNRWTHLVIGDFGLGNGYRNPPEEMAELWREVFLWDPQVRGRIAEVQFVFEDVTQCTSRLILDDMSKKSKHGGSSKGKSKSSSSHSSSSSSSASGPTDFQIFQAVFDPDEIQRVLHQPDPRCGVRALMTS